jgi:hypothetical protein
MDPATKDNIKFLTLVIGGFLLLKDIPVGELFTFASTACGLQ